ncbi:transcription termination factor Rho [Nocardioides daedukensis]|uniref:Transcription termination factor Rho n=1 Tax=Nocardioides daedukensis TaxID=634462 RepID=A0A7Y9S5Z0_9ACTN|nr:transcription termination factor Rho [Nocardioides daedukensis]
MSETTEPTTPTNDAPESAGAARKRGGGLNSMLIADLRSMAGGMGIGGAAKMKKADLVAAIKAGQSGGASASAEKSAPSKAAPEKQADQKQADQKSAHEKPAPDGLSDQRSAPEERAPEERAPEERAPEERAPEERAPEKQAPEKQAQANQATEKQAAPEQGESAAAAQEQGVRRRTRGERSAGQQDDRSGAERDDQGADGQGAGGQGAGSEQGTDRPQEHEQGEDRSGDRGRVRNRNRNRDQQNQPEHKQADQNQGDQNQSGQKQNDQKQNDQKQGGRDRQQGNQQKQDRQKQNDQKHNDQNEQGGHDQGQRGQSGNQSGDQDQGDGDGTGRNRRRRGRDRDRTGRGNRNEPDTTILDDDVLVPAAGILDVLDNYAFVRTSGYLAGADDVYLSLSMVRKFDLRRGDAVVGQVRQPREGERKEKFNPMVQIDSVNGADPEAVTDRVDFDKLTPINPTERLRLETKPTNLIGRIIDVVAPIGKGQRGLILSPAKAGKTTLLQSVAASITANNPECHLMVVLVDERPEEVTDFERSVKGEVISSTFDRPATDHTAVAELAIERAKRLVELGHDVVVLLDGVTRLARAYSNSTPASGRTLAGGVDSAALHPAKKFFGAARNIENGGSLTILATAAVEGTSEIDEVILEEFQGTANMELRLRRDFAAKRIFPAIDPVQSGTRREELLLGEEELAISWKLREMLSALETEQALETLIERMGKSQNNIEFLTRVQKGTGARSGTE